MRPAMLRGWMRRVVIPGRRLVGNLMRSLGVIDQFEESLMVGNTHSHLMDWGCTAFGTKQRHGNLRADTMHYVLLAQQRRRSGGRRGEAWEEGLDAT